MGHKLISRAKTRISQKAKVNKFKQQWGQIRVGLCQMDHSQRVTLIILIERKTIVLLKLIVRDQSITKLME